MYHVQKNTYMVNLYCCCRMWRQERIWHQYDKYSFWTTRPIRCTHTFKGCTAMNRPALIAKQTRWPDTNGPSNLLIVIYSTKHSPRYFIGCLYPLDFGERQGNVEVELHTPPLRLPTRLMAGVQLIVSWVSLNIRSATRRTKIRF